MYEYLCRVRLANGSFVDTPIRAISLGYAMNIVESQYGAGSFIAYLREDFIG